MMTQTANSYVAHNYAHALYGLCVQDHTEAETIAQLVEIYAAMRDVPGYMEMLSSPAIPKSERIEALDRAFAGSCSERAIGFLKVLIAHGHIASRGGQRRAADRCAGECADSKAGSANRTQNPPESPD